MARRCLGHLRAQWLGALALFLVLAGGSAYAFKLAPNSVRSKQIAPDAVQGVDVNEATLGQVPAAKAAGSATTAGTAALGGTGARGSAPGCDPGATYAACATATLALPSPARVLVNARGTPLSSAGVGECRIGTTSGPIPNAKAYVGATAGTAAQLNVSLTGVTDVLPAGTHSFGIDCTDFGGGANLQLQDLYVTAVALSAN